MNNTNKTKILNAAIELANEIRIALHEEKKELDALYSEIASGCGANETYQLMVCHNNVRRKQSQLDKALEQVDQLEDTLCQYYHSDSYDTFYKRALNQMHTMEGTYLEQTGESFS